MKGRFFEKLTIAPLVKFPTFNCKPTALYRVYLYLTIRRYSDLRILVILHGWFYMCVFDGFWVQTEVIISIISST